MKIDGACHCGEIRYEADVDPEKVALCNRTDCQWLSELDKVPGTETR